MNGVTYEKVNLNPNIPAMLGYWGKENIDAKSAFYIGPHWHRSIEITFLTEGQVEGVINGRSIKVNCGDFIFVNSGDVHEIEKKQGKLCGGIILVLSYDFIKSVYPNIDNIRFDIYKKSNSKKRLVDIFLTIKDIYLNPKELDYIKINSYIYEILYILLSDFTAEDDNSNLENYFKYRDKQKEILMYIGENYREELSLDKISKQFYMSSEYFSRKFHEWFGVTYKIYLANYRLSKAYEDLINSDDNIQDIALTHGFLNVKSFINIFKEKYNMTPSKYRQLINCQETAEKWTRNYNNKLIKNDNI